MSFDAEIASTIIAILTAGGSLLVALNSRTKAKMEVAQIVTDSALKLVKPLEERIVVLEESLKILQEDNKKLEDEVEKLKQENAELWEGVAILINQIHKIGETPIWRPRSKQDML